MAVFNCKLCIFVLVFVAAFTNKALAVMPLKNPDLAATNEGYFNFMEIYKKIDGFDDYKISNYGNVLSLKCGKEKQLKNSIHNNGYKRVCLIKNGKFYVKYIHQLVAITFLGHNPNGYVLVVDHINNIKTDNRVENLQLISNRENTNKTRVGKTSQHIGVDFRTSRNKWRARIVHNNKQVTIGHFLTEKEASESYLNYLNKII